MRTGAHATIGRMFELRGRLHPALLGGNARDVMWEMDVATFKELLTWRLPASGTTEVMQRLADGEFECIGIRVSVVDRPGVRLVLTVTE